MSASQESVTELLHAWRGGDRAAQERVLPLVYDQLRALARQHLRRETPGHTLQPTALVHEAFIRLLGADVQWQDQAHFCAIASRVMRRVLVDHARGKRAGKRGGDALRVTLSTQQSGDEPAMEDILTLDQALQDLEAFDPRKCQIIEMIYFGGLEHEAIGELLDISRTTVHRELKFAKAWLKRELGSAL